jgi:DNA invertase Pin-like site-specific DNA recombinase
LQCCLAAVHRVLAYCRASTNKQELDLQLHLLSQQGYDELFQEHISGRRRDRPEFERLVSRALELAGQGLTLIDWIVS